MCRNYIVAIVATALRDFHMIAAELTPKKYVKIIMKTIMKTSERAKIGKSMLIL